IPLAVVIDLAEQAEDLDDFADGQGFEVARQLVGLGAHLGCAVDLVLLSVFRACAEAFGGLRIVGVEAAFEVLSREVLFTMGPSAFLSHQALSVSGLVWIGKGCRGEGDEGWGRGGETKLLPPTANWQVLPESV